MSLDQQAAEAAERLGAWKALVENKAWKEEIYPALQKAVSEHREGLRDRSKTAEQCSRHVEASFLAEELEAMARTRIEELQRRIREYHAGVRDQLS